MPTPAAPSRAKSNSVSERLSPQDVAEATQVAQRLNGELRALIGKLPEADRGASPMSRALGMDRVTCQRIVGAVGKTEAEPATLVQLPGVQGLRQFVAAMRRRRGSRSYSDQLAAAEAAIERFDALLQRLGGSQRQLRARILADVVIGTGPGPASDEAAREALFEAAAAVTGRWSETLLDVRIVRPAPADERLTEGWRVRGYIGHESRPEALPLEMYGSAPLQQQLQGPAFVPLRGLTGDDAGLLLPGFCSHPLPRIISRSAGDRVFQLVEPDPSVRDAPIDILAASRASHPDAHPATLRPAIGEMWSVQMFPARRLLFDVYLHRDIARRCIPSLEVHLRSDDAHPLGSRRWSTRFPGQPRLEVIGPGAASEGYARHSELLGAVFSSAGLKPAEFVGYRCEVRHPVWRAGYCMVFDFEGNEL